jgi:hypothetical protein
METFVSFHSDTRHAHAPVHVRPHANVHPKVISGQSSATLGFQRDQGRLPGA